MPLSAAEKRELEKKMEAFVGKPIGPPIVATDLVNEPMIRHWCEAMGDTNPAYLDPAAAKESAHGGIVAPPTMLQAWTMGGFDMSAGYDEPTNEQQRLHKLLEDHGYTSVVATNTDQGYTRYLRPGDQVTEVTVIESVSEEKATALGIGYFINTRTTYTDQNGEEIGWLTFRVLKFIPSQQPQAAAADDGGAPAAPQRIRAPMGHDNSWWWEAVNEGKIPIQSCNGCGKLHHPPRPMCDQCRGMEMGYVEASGKGTVHTFTVIHHPQFPGYDFPIIAALIDLEEGTRLMSNVVECAPGDVSIGMPVQGFVQEGEDGLKIPVFRPA
ncbi:MAG: MaoC family dehydratase N-terminal domain-containing protein [Myxococcales bacterium]|nr:MaoC family dehydratase N-terminal domain-containing protein [Myxococcales bacterium]